MVTKRVTIWVLPNNRKKTINIWKQNQKSFLKSKQFNLSASLILILTKLNKYHFDIQWTRKNFFKKSILGHFNHQSNDCNVQFVVEFGPFCTLFGRKSTMTSLKEQKSGQWQIYMADRIKLEKLKKWQVSVIWAENHFDIIVRTVRLR